MTECDTPDKPCKVVHIGPHKSRTERPVPSAGQFTVIPKSNSALQSFIRSVVWNCVAKTIELEVLETPTFAAYEWISTINARHQELQKSPFSDLDQDSLTIQFKSADKKDVASVRVSGIEVKDHHCGLDRTYTTNLAHWVLLQYDRAEAPKSVLKDDPALDPFDTNGNVFADAEWMKDEAAGR